MRRRTLVALNEHGNRIGEHHPQAKLTQAAVNRLLDLRAQGWSLGQLAKAFTLSKSGVQHICSGQTWTQKPCSYIAAPVTLRSQVLKLALDGLAPALGPVPEDRDTDEWPRPEPDPVPPLPPLVDGLEPGQRVIDLITWTLTQTLAVAAAVSCPGVESEPLAKPPERE